MAEDQKPTTTATPAASVSETVAPKSAATPAPRVDRSSFSSSRVPADENAAGKTTIADGVVAKIAGIAAREVAGNVRAAVAGAISRLVGLEVVEVNVEVNDVHIPGADNDDENTESRVA